jgi:hypothetical protein
MKLQTSRRRVSAALVLSAVGALAVATTTGATGMYRSGQPDRDYAVEQPEGADQMTPAEIAQALAARQRGGGGTQPSAGNFPRFEDVSKDYRRVISTADGQSYFNLWVRERDGQMLAELPRGYENRKMFFATTVGGGDIYAGLQVSDLYCYWKRYDNQLALITPEMNIRSTGDAENRSSVDRIFTDRVVLSVPIVCMGPSGQPVIDMDNLLLGPAMQLFGRQGAGLNRSLATIAKAKAFPSNVEIAFEAPVAGGVLRTFHYSISDVPARTGYKPRRADERVGYFTTAYRDLGKVNDAEVPVRYINRWHLEKRDPKLAMSPPKEPIVFYIDSATPVRYRRWVRQGVEYWNKAFENIGIDGAIEVRFADAQTGAHMDKDPEDVRYNFIRWLTNDQGTAIGPSRVHPETGQILDADVVLTDGFLRGWLTRFEDIVPQIMTEGYSPDLLVWLEQNPRWDPFIRLAAPAEREQIMLERARARAAGVTHAGHPLYNYNSNQTIGNQQYDGLLGRTSQINGLCLAGQGMQMEMTNLRMYYEIAIALVDGMEAEVRSGAQPEIPENIPDEVVAMMRRRIAENPELAATLPAPIRARLGLDAEPEKDDEEKGAVPPRRAERPKSKAEQMLDGMPEEYVGPLLADLVAHEVGHTLGLRHNFKASSIYTLDQINSEEFKGKKPFGGSVMDYNGFNIRMATGDVQGDYAMIDIGPYDMWAIEYGYTFGNPEEVLKRVSEPELAYATDEDTMGPDPTAHRWDLGSDVIENSREMMRLAEFARGRILTDFVKDGQSWSRARRGYEITLNQQVRAVSQLTRWIGGAYVLRDKKGDPGDRTPLTPVEVETQREALEFIIAHSFFDDVYGITPELLRHMTTDRWLDRAGGPGVGREPAWPIHDRIEGIQASVLTSLMNPQRLGRVYDNEMRVEAGEDALTMPEVFSAITGAIWQEIDEAPSRSYTAREPMISSLRRNLQREHVDRLIDLSLDGGFGAAAKPISNLAMMELEMLKTRLARSMEGRNATRMDAYTRAHLMEASKRIEKALDAGYIYNMNAGGGGGLGALAALFGQPAPAPAQPAFDQHPSGCVCGGH